MVVKLQMTNLSAIAIDEESSLVKILAWCLTCDHPLTKLMMTQVSAVYARYYEEESMELCTLL